VLPAAASAVVASREAVWVATTRPELDPGDQILRIDPRTGAIADTLQVTDGVRRLVLARGGLWLLASKPSRLVRIDLQTGKRRRILLEGDTAGDLIWGAGAIWATLTDLDQLVRVDPRTGNGAIVAVGRNPAGLAMHGGSIWVANRASSTLSRVNARTLRVTDELEVPLNPYELAASRDGVWVTSLAEGMLTRVSAPR
jgi:virginiamycin B lyase